MTDYERDSMQYDVVIVGAGPAGLAAALRLKQLAAEQSREISVCVLEKGSEVGAHILSGAVMDPIALNELVPDWREKGAPLTCEVREDRVLFLTEKRAFKLPVPPSFQNHGNYIISLGALCRWLAEQAEEAGVEIYAGFAATEILYYGNGAVKGVATGDVGRNKDGSESANFQRGIELHARQTLFAEGVRGSLSQQIIKRFGLDKNSQPQTYGIGIKEIWEVAPEQSRPGLVMHSTGWPLDSKTYGGSFLYHLDNHQVAVGFVVGLDYENPYLSPFEEFQRFKTHPAVRATFEGGRRIAYGARALNEGGLQSLPELTFAGGALIGDAAGFLNVPRIKGSHTAIKSGMLCAEAVFALLNDESRLPENLPESELDENGMPYGETAVQYSERFRQSWLYRELHEARNIRPAFKWGLWPAFAYTALEQYLLKGRAPWTLRHHAPDYRCLKKAADCTPIAYPKPDGKLTFDRLSSVFLANTAHDENQPVHLHLRDPQAAVAVNYREYAAPETRYCPAGVYETVCEGEEVRLQINAANCVHCKTCDIKDPTQNIEWTCPEGGSGPNYGAM